MKRIYLLFIFMCFQVYGFTQSGTWTWMAGNNTGAPTGNFGVQGIPSPSNTPPGFYEATEWTDLNGKFWLFGGYGGGVYGDLWRFDPVTNEWTWMKGAGNTSQPPVFGVQGIPSVLNTPGNQQWCSASWTDLQGNLWLFGGSDGGGAHYNLLWKYDISNNMWTWMNGSPTSGNPGYYGIKGVASALNNPPSRWETNATWTDTSGNLWLFGGFTGNGHVNDLWKYEIATNTWTWMKGSNGLGQPGIYGTKGIADTLNTPGARQSYAKWQQNNELWLFGGFASGFSYNDLWKYDVLSNSWTWVSGSNINNDTGLYVNYCQGDSLFLPGAAFENRGSWLADDGSFYVYGGYNNSYMKEDLWKYCPDVNQWTWVKGSSGQNISPIYGTLGLPAQTNSPGGRMGSLGWKDNTGNLWLFGGWGIGFQEKNDLWRFTPDSTCETCNPTPSLLPLVNLSSSDTSFCDKKCIDFTDLSTNNPTSWQWYFPGADSTSSTLQNPVNICYNSYGSFDVTLIACNAAGCDTLFLPSFIAEYPLPPQPIITQSNDTLYTTPANSYAWYDVSNPGNIISTDSFYVTSSQGSYFVIISDSNGCQNSSSVFVSTGISGQQSPMPFISIFPQPAQHVLTIVQPFDHTEMTFQLIDITGRLVYESKSVTPKTIIPVDFLSNGIYFFKCSNAKIQQTNKIVILH